MVETDCPYWPRFLIEEKRCEPAHTRLVAEHIARERNVPLEVIAHQTTATAKNSFALTPFS